MITGCIIGLGIWVIVLGIDVYMLNKTVVSLTNWVKKIDELTRSNSKALIDTQEGVIRVLDIFEGTANGND